MRCRPGYIADSGRLKGAIEIRVSLEDSFGASKMAEKVLNALGN